MKATVTLLDSWQSLWKVYAYVVLFDASDERGYDCFALPALSRVGAVLSAFKVLEGIRCNAHSFRVVSRDDVTCEIMTWLHKRLDDVEQCRLMDISISLKIDRGLVHRVLRDSAPFLLDTGIVTQ